MTDQQPRPGDRVRVTFEAIASFGSEKGLTVILPGDDEFAQRFCVVPAHATVEVLKPLPLAERMATLAEGFERTGDAMFAEAAAWIRKGLAAQGEARAAQPEVLCPRCGHGDIITSYLAAGDRVAGGVFSRVLRDWLSRRCRSCDHWWQEFPADVAKEEQ